MQFRTPINITPCGFRIGYAQRGLLLGSCFAENIGMRMKRYKLPVVFNPFGILFNPASVARTLTRLDSGKLYEANNLTRSGDLWVSFDHHGSLASVDRDEALKTINQAVQSGARALREAGYLILTLGTAWVYQLRETGEIVCNCHKRPSGEFLRRRLSVDEVVGGFVPLLEGPLKDKPVIWTVSPVRHLGDGLPENALSKSTLIVAIHRLIERYPQCCYFPAFEIMTDDLRDYRFYEKDMAHPSEVAVDYIWEQFCCAALDPSCTGVFRKIDALNRALAHRPLNPENPAYRAFRHQNAAEVRALQQAYPDLDFSRELNFFES